MSASSQEARGEPALAIEGLSFTYPGAAAPALDSVSLFVRENEFFGLLGPNGAGKTTLIHLLAGLLAPDSGRARLQGLPTGAPETRRRVGLCPQDLALYGSLTASENLALFGRLAGIPRPQLAKRIRAALEGVGLAPSADRRVEEFSGGMKRRLNLGIALMHEPRLLLLDEPTAGVDSQSRNLIFESLVEIKRRGATIVYTTHYLEEAERLCETIAIIDRGRILVSADRDAFVHDRGAPRYIVEFDGHVPPSLLSDLATSGIEVRSAAPNTLEFSTEQTPPRVGAIEERARGLGLSIVRFERRRSTLEERFLDLTGRGLRD